MFTRLLTFFILSAFLPQAYACSCWGSEDFYVANGHPEVTVVMAKKIKKVNHGMEIKVLEQFSGSPIADRVTVWGDVGYLCRLYTETFEDGETYILGINGPLGPRPDDWKDRNDGTEKEKEGDYVISVCGLHWLNVNGNQVSASWGSVNGTDTQMHLDDFRELFANLIPLQISFFESPDGPYIDIALAEGITQAGTIDLIDLSGRVKKQIALLPDELTRYALAYPDLPSGIYVLRVQLGSVSVVRKIALNQP
ncbi:MAG: T9SS type A sorting domain-containing protein [Bacteroidota bacterium]